MTKEQKYKLARAISLIEESQRYKGDNHKVLSTWLRVAGDYCQEVAEEVKSHDT